MATIRVADIALPGTFQFWNSKIGCEGYTTGHLSRYMDQVREWPYAFMVGSGRKFDTLIWQAGEAATGKGSRLGPISRPEAARIVGAITAGPD